MSADARSTQVAAGTLTVSVPAHSAYMSVLRSAATGVAAALDWPLDDLEDLRIAVDEAGAMLLRLRPRDGIRLECERQGDDGLAVRLLAVTGGRPVSTDGFAWRVLTALSDTVEASVDADTTCVTLHKSAGSPDVQREPGA